MSTTISVPSLRFPEFDGEWAKVKFKRQINSITSGKTKSQTEGAYNVFGSTGIIGKANICTHNGKYILIARVGANAGTLNMVSGEFSVTDNTLIIDVNNNSIIDFLYYKLKQFRLNRMAFGSGQPLITGGQLKRLNLYFPLLPEQKKIANFLTAIDKRTHQLEEQKRLLTEYKKGVMQQIFSQQIRFTDNNSSPYPDWQEKRLGDVCKCLDNQRIPLNNAQRSKMKGDIPYWGANNIIDYVNDYIFDKPLILLAEDGGYFDAFQTRPIANISYGKCWVNNHVHILKAKKNILTEYAYLSLVHKNILGYINTGTRAKLNKEDMLKIPLSVPSLIEQRKIASFSMAIGNKIEQVAAQLKQAKTFKKGLLQQMFV